MKPDDAIEIYNHGFRAGQQHSKPSQETCERLERLERRLSNLFAVQFVAFLFVAVSLGVIAVTLLSTL